MTDDRGWLREVPVNVVLRLYDGKTLTSLLSVVDQVVVLLEEAAPFAGTSFAGELRDVAANSPELRPLHDVEDDLDDVMDEVYVFADTNRIWLGL